MMQLKTFLKIFVFAIDIQSLMRYSINRKQFSNGVNAMIQRNTIQCALVLDAVKKLKCHATADEVYDLLSREHPNFSRATVYRNLQRLCEAGNIRKREVPGGADCFDHCCSDHYHIKCIKCGRVFDVNMEYKTGLEKTIKDTRGFEFTGHDIMFTGICPECKEIP